jgi:hypothetical protein
MATYNVSTAAALIGALNGGEGYTRATYGDVVNVAAGTYDCRISAGGSVLAPQAGVTILGAGIGRSIVLGELLPDHDGDVAPTTLAKITFDASGENPFSSYGAFSFYDGVYRLIDCEFIGGSADNAVTFVASTSACRGLMLRCQVHHAYNDCISTKAPGGAGVAAGSLLALIDCIGHTPGTGTSDNCLTAHEGFRIDDYRGYYYGAQGGPTVNPESAASPMYLYGTRIVHHGTSANTIVAAATQFDHCLIDNQNGSNTIYAYAFGVMQDCEIRNCRAGNRTGGANPTIFRRNRLSNGSITMAYNTGDVTIEKNVVRDFANANTGGIGCESAYASTLTIDGNTVTGCSQGFRLRRDASPTVGFKNNVTWGNTTNSVAVATGAAGTLTYAGTSGNNVLNGTASGYTEQTGDVTTAPSAAQQAAAAVLPFDGVADLLPIPWPDPARVIGSRGDGTTGTYIRPIGYPGVG